MGFPIGIGDGATRRCTGLRCVEGWLMGVQAGQRVWRRAYAPTPIFEYVVCVGVD